MGVTKEGIPALFLISVEKHSVFHIKCLSSGLFIDSYCEVKEGPLHLMNMLEDLSRNIASSISMIMLFLFACLLFAFAK